MKTFKESLSETVEPVKSPDEQNFIDKHIVDKKEHPTAGDDHFKGKTKKSKTRSADQDEGKDAEVYEAADDMIECEDCGESYKRGEEHECDMGEGVSEEMTDKQMKKREEIVKSMKKKMGEFKDKYGDKAKDVMYATATKMAMKEEAELSEGVIDDLRKIVKTKSRGSVKFADGSKLPVDMFTASAMTKVHDALNGANQKKFADAINKNESMFMKMMDFAMSKVG